MKNIKKSLLVGCMVSCFSIAMLVGCNSNKDTTKELQNQLAASKTTTQTLQQQLKLALEDNSKLKDELNSKSSTMTSTPLEEFQKSFPGLSPFTTTTIWKSITLISGKSKVTLIDPTLLENLSPLFIVKGQAKDLTNGPIANISPFSIELKNDSTLFSMDVDSRNIVSFPKFNTSFVEINDEGLSQLGVAFLPRPVYLPQESLESRILNSGLVHIQKEELNLYSTNRVRLLATTYLQSEKKKTSKPKTISSDKPLDLTFFCYGEQINIKVYSKCISLQEGKKISYYEITPTVSQQLLSCVTAS